MKRHIMAVLFALISSAIFSQNTIEELKKRPYIPKDKALYEEIVAMDKEYFDAYNNCDLEKQALLYSEDLEFFHDQGGLNTSKKEILSSIETNICGKVTRILVEGSIEVYAINGYGAIEMGYHRFYNNQEPNAESRASRFIVVWKKDEDNWLITKVISLH